MSWTFVSQGGQG